MHLVLIVIVNKLTAQKEEKKMPVQINHWDFVFSHFKELFALLGS